MSDYRPISADEFHHHGRGPELIRVIWSERGSRLLAIEYYNPEDPYDKDHLRHVRFINPQVVMCTPEEVTGDFTFIENKSESKVAVFDLGRSDWFGRFNPHHLGRSSHYRLLFCDELYDVIAEGIEFKKGGYSGEKGSGR